MKLTKTLRRSSQVLLLAALINASACGYFLYPERQGQSGGSLDPAVVLLDAAGLFLGILPGVVAFAVDFTNGTIYLPPGGASAIDKHRHKLSEHSATASDSQREALAAALSKQLGVNVDAATIELYLPSQPLALSDAQRIAL